ncbi:MAG: hypothetical protein Fur0042_07410 [Cyanophyceae cyanobacterium]
MANSASAMDSTSQLQAAAPLPLSADRQIEYLQLQADIDLLLEELETRCRQQRLTAGTAH